VTPFGLLVRPLAPQGLLSLGDQLVVHACHHHALFLDQTVSDALGGEGWAVRRQAAFESAHALIASFCSDFGVTDPVERLELASELFTAMGHGRLTFEITAEGGIARGHSLHHGASFVEKYATLLKNRRPVDAFTAGFISAAASLAYPSDWGTLEADETTCVAQLAAHPPECIFTLTRRPERPRFGAVVTRGLVEQIPLAPADEGDRQRHPLRPGPGPEAERAVTDLARLLHGAPVDHEGVTRAFGVRLALVPVSYLGQITYDTVHLVEKRAPELFPLVGALVREAAQIGAFHLLGGVLASAPWKAEHGPLAEDPEARLDTLIGLTRALGWGAFQATEFTPGEALVLAAKVTHESAYYAVRHGNTVRNRLFFQQGLALALMQILHRVDFSVEDPVGKGVYDGLFKTGQRFHVDETRSPLRGDRVCEVVVTALAER
jgi:predicted hydrocarbon binding protein